MLGPKGALKGLWLALSGVFVAAACSSSEGSGPPKAGCPNGFCAIGPFCGEGCQSPCGCCGCQEGQGYERNGVNYVCTGGCLAGSSAVDGGTGGTGGSAGAAGSAGQAQDANACDGCSQWEICNQACPDPCGCCACTEGQQETINGFPHLCSGGCFVQL